MSKLDYTMLNEPTELLKHIHAIEAENKALREAIARVEPLVEKWEAEIELADQRSSYLEGESCLDELKQALENE